MKIGISLKLDVTKLNKERFFTGAKGTYCDLTAFIDTEITSQYGDHGVITQSTSKEEREAKVQLPICGNVKVFYTKADSPGPPPIPESQINGQGSTPQTEQYTEQGGTPLAANSFDDDIPF